LVAFGHRETVNRVVRDVKVAYYDLALADRSIEIVERNKQLVAQLLQIAQGRYTVGQGAQADLLRALADICVQRKLSYHLTESLRASAAPSAPDWQQRWENAVASLGLSVHRMPSGAGHDAMKLHDIMPQAMLFVRGQNAGISHNPLESSTSDDMQLAVEAFGQLLGQLGNLASVGPNSFGQVFVGRTCTRQVD